MYEYTYKYIYKYIYYVYRYMYIYIYMYIYNANKIYHYNKLIFGTQCANKSRQSNALFRCNLNSELCILLSLFFTYGVQKLFHQEYIFGNITNTSPKHHPNITETSSIFVFTIWNCSGG